MFRNLLKVSATQEGASREGTAKKQRECPLGKVVCHARWDVTKLSCHSNLLNLGNEQYRKLVVPSDCDGRRKPFDLLEGI